MELLFRGVLLQALVSLLSVSTWGGNSHLYCGTWSGTFLLLRLMSAPDCSIMIWSLEIAINFLCGAPSLCTQNRNSICTCVVFYLLSKKLSICRIWSSLFFCTIQLPLGLVLDEACRCYINTGQTWPRTKILIWMETIYREIVHCMMWFPEKSRFWEAFLLGENCEPFCKLLMYTGTCVLWSKIMDEECLLVEHQQS